MTERDQQKAVSNELFQSFLQSAPVEAEQILSRLITEHAEPVIKQVIQYKLQGSHREIDSQDLHHDIVLQLISRLRQLRDAPENRFIQRHSG